MARMKLGTNTGFLDINGVEIRVGDELINTKNDVRGVVNMYGQFVPSDCSGALKLQGGSWAIDKPYRTSVQKMADSESLAEEVATLKKSIESLKENNSALAQENIRLRSILDGKGVSHISKEDYDKSLSYIKELESKTVDLNRIIIEKDKMISELSKVSLTGTEAIQVLRDAGWKGQLTRSESITI